MSKNVMRRNEFAALCAAQPSVITRNCAPGRPLAPACVGKRIDANHPAAIQFLEDRKNPPKPWTEQIASEGTDPLYAQAVAACQEANRWSAVHIQETFQIPRDRARAINRMIKASGAHGRPAPPGPKPLAVAVAPPPAPTHAPDPAPPEAHEIPEEIQDLAHLTLRELVRKFGSDLRFLEWLKAVEKIEVIEARRLKNAETAGRLVSRDLVRRAIIDPFTNAHLRLISDGAKTIAAGAASKAGAGADLPEIETYVAEILGSFLKPVKAKVARGLRDA